jgi:hypothetical protein
MRLEQNLRGACLEKGESNLIRDNTLRAVWFVAKCTTLCLRLVIRIEELTLDRKVRQNVAS